MARVYKGHPVDRRIRKMAQGILTRTNKKRQTGKNACYKGVECRVGRTLSEVMDFIECNFWREIEESMKRGEFPTIDRIDSGRHYEEGNLRIISLPDNTRLGLERARELNSIPVRVVYPEGREESFGSITEAAKHFGISPKTVKENAQKKRRVSAGKAAGIYFELW